MDIASFVLLEAEVALEVASEQPTVINAQAIAATEVFTIDLIFIIFPFVFFVLKLKLE
jgi:hypothetical protein